MSEEQKNNVLNGIAAAPGISIAKAYIYSKEKVSVKDSDIEDIEEAKKNLEEALKSSKKELNKILNLAIDKMGKNRAGIFEAQIMILDDPVLLENIYSRIEHEKKSPEFIVDDEISKYQKIMYNSDEPYMKERSYDIEDIKNRIIRNLQKKKLKSWIQNDVIVVTESLTPADTVLFSRSNVRGYTTDFGGLTSHAAIVARSLNIPAIVGLHDATRRIKQDDLLIVDGFHGEVIVNPDEDQLNYFREKIERLHEYDIELAKLKNEPAVTLDGHRISLMGNLDLIDEMELIIQNGAEGIGLVRTEQIFSDSNQFPPEEEQYNIYSDLAEKVYPGMVIIRAFDIGGDKVLPVDIKEPNPFLGWRGIRLLLDNPEVFKLQIKAVLRASKHKNLKFMLPMISSIAEVRKTKKIFDLCKKELKAAGEKFDPNLGLGIMIEIPSAAVLANEFASEVDFMSIGTNDLIQYLLAVDRGNDIVSGQYQEFHPAVLRTIKHIIKEGKTGNVFVSICGEMAADTLAVPLLVGLGLDSLSVSPSAIPFIKKIIRSLNYSEVSKLAEECLTLKTEEEVSGKLKEFFNDKIKLQADKIF